MDVCAEVAHHANTQVTHTPMCCCCGLCVPCSPGEWVPVVSGGFVSWVGGCQVRAVLVPNGSFSSQENSDVFLSIVDTDWKVGPAMGGAAHPRVSHGTAACAWGRLGGTEYTQGCCCPFFVGM